jgi:lipopolysaccharide transport system permease protein
MNASGKQTIHIRAKDPGFVETVLELVASRELLWVLVLRQIRARYAQTAFGAFWVLFQPLMAAALYTLVFGIFVKVPTAGVPYVLFSYSAMVVWTVFSQGFDRAGISLVQDERLITKIYFPRLHLPFSAALSTLPDLAVSIVVLLPLAWAFGFAPEVRLFWAIPAIAAPLLLSMGAGAIIASLNVRWRDLRQLAPFLVQIGVWATPVAYPLEVAPDRWRDILLLNPLTPPVLLFRHAVVGSPFPPWWSLASSMAIALGLFFLGCVIFRRVEKTFADYI